jgi:hypothetical protein
MSAATFIPEHYTQEFETNWHHKAQERDNVFFQYVTPRKFTGEEMRCNLLDPDDEP